MVGSYTPARALSAPLNGATFVSSYSGCGGLDLGFRMAGFEPLWANDIDAVAMETYRTLLGDHAVAGPIESVKLPKRGSADLVIGGPPCQGFSVAGRMDPDDPRSVHVDRFMDLVQRVRPQGFVMENVKALAVSDRWSEVRAHLQRRATALGFKTSLFVLHAADFGVAQRRERMFFIGIRGGAEPPSTLEPAVPKHLSVRAALDALPPFGAPGNDTRCNAIITPARRPVLRPTAHRGSLLFNGNGRPLRLDMPAPTLPASMGGNATPILDEKEWATGEASWVVGYHRRLMRGGAPVQRVPRHLRRITVEEAAQLQAFPVGMEWQGTRAARFRQVGNAVPPLLAYAVANAVADAIGISVSRQSRVRLAA
jgi:DNA (cytosine-5)-methyltransferase 1